VEGVAQGDLKHAQCRQAGVLMAKGGVEQVFEVVDGSVVTRQSVSMFGLFM